MASSGRELSSSVADRFARAEFFVIYDTESGEYEVVENTVAGSHGAGPRVVQMLASYGVDALVVPGVGQNAFGAIMAAGIEVYQSVPGSVEKNIELFKEGKLEKITSPTRMG